VTVGSIWTIGLLVALAILPTQASSQNGTEKPSSVKRTFRLQDQEGKPVTERALHGRPAFVFFGYTSCPDVCPTGLVEIALAMTQLERRGLVVSAVFVTVDPVRDSGAVLTSYLSAFHPRLIGLTGSKQEIANAAAAFGVEFGAKSNGSISYVWHTSSIYLLDAQGRVAHVFRPYTKASTIVAETAARFGAEQDKSRRSK